MRGAGNLSLACGKGERGFIGESHKRSPMVRAVQGLFPPTKPNVGPLDHAREPMSIGKAARPPQVEGEPDAGSGGASNVTQQPDIALLIIAETRPTVIFQDPET